MQHPSALRTIAVAHEGSILEDQAIKIEGERKSGSPDWMNWLHSDLLDDEEPESNDVLDRSEVMDQGVELALEPEIIQPPDVHMHDDVNHSDAIFPSAACEVSSPLLNFDTTNLSDPFAKMGSPMITMDPRLNIATPDSSADLASAMLGDIFERGLNSNAKSMHQHINMHHRSYEPGFSQPAPMKTFHDSVDSTFCGPNDSIGIENPVNTFGIDVAGPPDPPFLSTSESSAIQFGLDFGQVNDPAASAICPSNSKYLTRPAQSFTCANGSPVQRQKFGFGHTASMKPARAQRPPSRDLQARKFSAVASDRLVRPIVQSKIRFVHPQIHGYDSNQVIRVKNEQFSLFEWCIIHILFRFHRIELDAISGESINSLPLNLSAQSREQPADTTFHNPEVINFHRSNLSTQPLAPPQVCLLLEKEVKPDGEIWSTLNMHVFGRMQRNLKAWICTSWTCYIDWMEGMKQLVPRAIAAGIIDEQGIVKKLGREERRQLLGRKKVNSWNASGYARPLVYPNRRMV